MGTREAILALGKRTKDVEVEGVGAVRVRALTAKESVAFGLMENGAAFSDSIIIMLARCIVDESGARVFGENEADDLGDALTPDAMIDLLDAIMELSGFGGSGETTEDEGEEKPDPGEAQPGD